MHVGIVILNYNGLGFLKKYLPGVIRHSPSAEIIVADNASTDASILWLENEHPNVRLIKLKTNLGFAAGYNEALKQVSADIYVLLNSDVEVTENWLDPCIKYLKNNAQVAALQPKIRAESNRDSFEYAGAAGGHMDWLGYPFARGRLFDTLEYDHGQYNDPEKCFWATGACLFIRSEDFHAQNGFDPYFFAHMEEIDLCWRLQLSCREIHSVPSSVVYHVGGGTLAKTSPKKTFLNFRNGILMLYKNLPASTKWLIIFLRLILDGMAGLQFLLKGQPKHCLAIIRGHFNAYFAIASGKVHKNPHARELDSLYSGSIVYQYFIKGKKRYSDL